MAAREKRMKLGCDESGWGVSEEGGKWAWMPSGVCACVRVLGLALVQASVHACMLLLGLVYPCRCLCKVLVHLVVVLGYPM